MKAALIALGLLISLAGSARAADPIYLDQLIEMPLATLRAQFTDLKREGCYRIGDGRYLFVTVDKKEQKPWRVVLTSIEPCRKPIPIADLDIRERTGVALGDTTVKVVAALGRPDAAAPPDSALRKLGETEYFYICRVEDGCARHTSVFIKDGVVSAISQWYSE